MGSSLVGSPSQLTDATSDVTLFVEMPTDVRSRLEKYHPIDADDDTVEVLRQTFKHLPPDGRANLAEDIANCQSDSGVYQLGQHLITGLLTPLQVAGGKIPSITPSPRIGVEDSIENLASTIDESMKRKQEELRKQCRRRDGEMCVISGFYNAESLETVPPGKTTARLEAAHIVPFAIASFKDEPERQYITSVWNTLYRYFPSVRSRINFQYTNINSLANAMMLERGVHTEFGKFNLALEPTAVPNQYEILTFPLLPGFTRMALPTSSKVTLVAHDGRDELPSPILLQLHAAIAKILHATGRADATEKVLRDYDAIEVIARDGSTNLAALLSVSRLPSLEQRHPNVRRPNVMPNTAEEQKPAAQSSARASWPYQSRTVGKEN
ncbi:hypothetical protein ASPZODRAFT_137195 [Penicilliopsis zonata CBS 506.65]|uniref:HNH nuclease domain-containing protein n=1 Tax=Penicilliopsis zonata CBS 506.65 TaxID=1073090 RepID=A0A1L9S5X9_9EURO|nr:hypothetical protein ASPZODRAFT_137195 [Penicilliopsis zonata CBS 506.65]OJJ42576.1 hypothetical protein ASPZODRAFT_137195 [Penicilliopsis zonata CBS 506.65]